MKLKNHQKYQTPRVGQTPLELEFGVLQAGSIQVNGQVDMSRNINAEDTSEPLYFEF